MVSQRGETSPRLGGLRHDGGLANPKGLGGNPHERLANPKGQSSKILKVWTNGLWTVDYGLITQDSSLPAALPFPGIKPRLPGI
jgi:hypothetical protein